MHQGTSLGSTGLDRNVESLWELRRSPRKKSREDMSEAFSEGNAINEMEEFNYPESGGEKLSCSHCRSIEENVVSPIPPQTRSQGAS